MRPIPEMRVSLKRNGGQFETEFSLHGLPAFAEEHIDRTTQWIRPQFIAHQPTETVVALAHIGAALVDEILLLGTKP